jgi:hypothetical protein
MLCGARKPTAARLSAQTAARALKPTWSRSKTRAFDVRLQDAGDLGVLCAERNP